MLLSFLEFFEVFWSFFVFLFYSRGSISMRKNVDKTKVEVKIDRHQKAIQLTYNNTEKTPMTR